MLRRYSANLAAETCVRNAESSAPVKGGSLRQGIGTMPSMVLAATGDSPIDWVPLAIVFAVVIVVLIGVIAVNMREIFSPRSFYGRLNAFVPRRVRDAMQIHDKTYPGYDLASLNRALLPAIDELCATRVSLGACQIGTDLRTVFSSTPNQYQKRMKPVPPAYQRLPVDVDDEESFISNCVWLCTLKQKPQAAPSGDASPESGKIVVYLNTAGAPSHYDDEDMDLRAPRAATISISIACDSKAIAGRFFDGIETRRKELSVFRGKVIDPVVGGGGIRTIGFRQIHSVTADDLVLPGDVKDLVERSIVGFFKHQDALRKLGVDLKRGILFHGHPGTGKTSISLYLAGLLPNFTVCFVSGQRLLYPREICRMARYLQPTIVVFEDIDLIAQERDRNGLATVLGELMNQIDGCEPADQVLFILNTNSLDRLESAVRNRPGRVDQIIHIPLPDAAARADLMRLFARHLKLAADTLDRVSAATEGATPAMLKEVIKRAAVYAVERTHDGDALEITEADLLLAAKQVQFLRDQIPLGPRIAETIL